MAPAVPGSHVEAAPKAAHEARADSEPVVALTDASPVSGVAADLVGNALGVTTRHAGGDSREDVQEPGPPARATTSWSATQDTETFANLGVGPAQAVPIIVAEPEAPVITVTYGGGQRRLPQHGRYTIQLPAALFDRVEVVRDGWPRTSWLLTLIGAHHDTVAGEMTAGLVTHPQLGTVRRRTRRGELGATRDFQLQFGRTERGRSEQIFFEERAGAAGSLTEYVVGILEAHVAAVNG